MVAYSPDLQLIIPLLLGGLELQSNAADSGQWFSFFAPISNYVLTQLREYWLALSAAIAASLLLLILVTAKFQRSKLPIAAQYSDDGDHLERIYQSYSISDTQSRRIASASRSIAPAAPKDGAVVAWLNSVDGNSEIKFAIRAKAVRIGRHSTNDVVISDSSVHRYHGVLVLNSNGVFELTDLGGANGCFVNGVRRERAELENGDIVTFGQVQLKFQALGV